MAAITSFKRYEKKFILTDEQYDALIPRLLEYMDPDEHCKDGNEYTIYNLYYDTEDNDLIRTSLAKPYYKEKLRLRSYFVPKSPQDTVFLELKKKINGCVNKRRVVISLDEANRFVMSGERPKAKDYGSEQIINEIAYFLKNNTVSPACYVSYNRMAYFGKDDKDFRLTFDTKITTRRESLLLEKGSFGEDILEPHQHLMEVKILGAMPMWLTNIFSELGIFTSSFSKYGRDYRRYCIRREENKEKEKEKIC